MFIAGAAMHYHFMWAHFLLGFILFPINIAIRTRCALAHPVLVQAYASCPHMLTFVVPPPMISTSDSIMVLSLPQPRPTKTRTTTNPLNPHLLSRPLTLPLLATMTIKMMILMCMPVTDEDSDAVLPELAAGCGVPGLRLEA
jgi:hypothetical protein